MEVSTYVPMKFYQFTMFISLHDFNLSRWVLGSSHLPGILKIVLIGVVSFQWYCKSLSQPFWWPSFPVSSIFVSALQVVLCSFLGPPMFPLAHFLKVPVFFSFLFSSSVSRSIVDLFSLVAICCWLSSSSSMFSSLLVSTVCRTFLTALLLASSPVILEAFVSVFLQPSVNLSCCPSVLRFALSSRLQKWLSNSILGWLLNWAPGPLPHRSVSLLGSLSVVPVFWYTPVILKLCRFSHDNALRRVSSASSSARVCPVPGVSFSYVGHTLICFFSPNPS